MDNITRADAGSSPASTAEAEFDAIYESFMPGGSGRFYMADLRAAHRRAVEAATADAYNRGFKDAAALAANSVRQAREETWREAANLHRASIAVLQNVGGVDTGRLWSIATHERSAEEFERRAAMSEPK